MKLRLNQLNTHLAIVSVVASLLGGCVSPNHKNRDAQRIYFSHSFDQSEKSALLREPPTNSYNILLADQKLPEVVLHFDNDSAEVRDDDIERLQSFLLTFSGKQFPVFLITGHTDSSHSDIYNIGLSDRRAKSTQAQMLRMGVPITQTALRGLGESTPVASNTSYDGRQSNRRVTVRAINKD